MLVNKIEFWKHHPDGLVTQFRLLLLGWKVKSGKIRVGKEEHEVKTRNGTTYHVFTRKYFPPIPANKLKCRINGSARPDHFFKAVGILGEAKVTLPDQGNRSKWSKWLEKSI